MFNCTRIRVTQSILGNAFHNFYTIIKKGAKSVKVKKMFVMKNNVNNVNANVAKANANANAMLYKDMFANFKKETASLMPTSLGMGGKELYKKSVMEGLNERQTKAMRKKIRDFLFGLMEGINQTKNEKLILSFIDFYKATYVINDFSFSSLASENTKESKKDVIKKGLEIVKQYVAKNNQ